MNFDGATFDKDLDGARLARQLSAVKRYLLARRGGFATLSEIAGALRFPEASISARLRDLRKPKFGAYQVERRRVSRGLFEYRVLPRVPDQLLMPFGSGVSSREAITE
jgi:hypothetical protein